jgi:hypothetical protein
MSENLRYYNDCCKVPDEAKKPITGGRLNGKTDINAMWRIKKLTEMFGPAGTGWRVVIRDKRLEPGANGEIAAFVDIDLYYKENGEWSEPIPGIGGNMFVAKETKGMYTDDDCFKKAYTDAISVAAKALGVGGDVYWEKDPGKYDKKDGKPQGNPPKGNLPKGDDFIKGLEKDKRKANVADVCKEIQAIRIKIKMPEKQFEEKFLETYEVDYFEAGINDLNKCLTDMKARVK